MNKLPKRKQIRVKDYDYSQNGYYFVTICTYKKQSLFKTSIVGNDPCVVPSDEPQNKIIEKWLLKLKEKYDIKIDYYVIMPNHIHLILVINSERHMGRSLPEMMRWFKTMTTNEYINLVKHNILKPFDKKLWQKSYYEHIIRDEEDYINTAQYILDNPLKWDIKEKYGITV